MITYFLVTAGLLAAWSLLTLTGSERERLRREAEIKQTLAARALLSSQQAQAPGGKGQH